MQTYADSYTKGAPVESVSEFSLWPYEVKQQLAAGEETMETYAEKKYFNNI